MLPLNDDEAARVKKLERSTALRSFLKGTPLQHRDADAFWETAGGRSFTGNLLKRAVESFGDDTPADPRLPSLSTCYGLFNLHRLLDERFAGEAP